MEQYILVIGTAIVTGVGTLIKMMYDERRATHDVAKSAKQAVINTNNVSNGFAGTVLEMLRRIDQRLDDHIQWHLEKEKENG